MTRPRVLALSLVGALLAGALLAACTQFSALGSVIGGGLSVALVVTAWLLTATTQAGCDTFGACLSIVPPTDLDATVGPCLSDSSFPRDADVPDTFGPCLSQAPDAGPPDTAGPCLSDVGGADALGPCLSIDAGPPTPDAEPLDAGTSTTSDAAAGPELARHHRERARQDAIDRLAAAGTLPADVVAKLRGRS